MKKIILSMALTGLLSISWSQSNTVATGGDATGTGGSVSYSIGQIDYISGTGSDGSINQGVQQPFEFFKDVGLEETSEISTQLYPNPTNEHVVLAIENPGDDLSYQLYDVKGKLIATEKISETETLIDMRALSAGSYNLSILKQHTQIESIKIIKH